MQPVRIITPTAASTLLLLAFVDDQSARYDLLLMIAISVIGVLDNRLKATAITEFARPF
ncbi:hypothetical protein [Mycobacterium uberis]|uniref:hypothetical protein n=1 Tax=Mycobacterium uberis TaxID=2162698 RepID=UPI001FB1BA5F|nr:hypothetical protein [Mycobacterium uberis]